MICEHPIIVIGLPVYNEARFIAQTIASLKSQTFENFKVLVSDNCSTDGSWKIINESVQADERFICVRQSENVGSAGNFNFLFHHTSSPYFMWLGAHDLLAPNYLSELLQVLQANPQISLGYSFVKWIDHDSHVLRISNGGDFLHEQNDGLLRYLACIRGPWGECTAVNNIFRRSAIPVVGFQPYPSTDYLILAGAQFHGRFYRHPDALYMRRHFEKTTSGYLSKITGKAVVGKTVASRPIVRWQLGIGYLRLYAEFPVAWYRKVIYIPRLVYSIIVGSQLHKAWLLWILSNLKLR